jgi:hypothetical protein
VVEPTITAREYKAQWFRPWIDSCELAKLRKSGWTVKQMAVHFGVCASSIDVRIRAFKENGKLGK